MNIRTVEGLLARRVDIDEILRLRAENERLEKEADWLANVLKQGCVSGITCDCPAAMCRVVCPVPDATCRHILKKDWREAARCELDKREK